MTRLKDCCVFQEGYVNPSQKNENYFNGSIKWLRSMDLNNDYVFSTSRTLTVEGYESAGKSAYMFPKNTIAISKSGTIAELGILQDRMCANRAIIGIQVDEKKTDLMYVFYFLKFKKQEIIKKAVGSIQKNLYISELSQLELCHDGINEQKSISKILACIDDKIRNNNAIKSELESLATTIYDYWFLQFDFPDENGKPYKSSGGKMVWNEEMQREIPEGWKSTTIGNITNCYDFNRIPLSNADREKRKGNIPYYGATGILDYVNEAIFDGDYVLMAEDGSVMNEKGNPILQRLTGKAWVNNHAHVLKPSKTHGCKLLMMLLKDIPVMKIKTGSIQMKINQENMKKIVVPDIPENLIDSINIILDDIDRQIIYREKENQELVSLRDFLLPLLMNGQVGF